MADLIAKFNVRSGGKRIRPGEPFSIEIEAVAEDLVKRGAAERAQPSEGASGEPSGKNDNAGKSASEGSGESGDQTPQLTVEERAEKIKVAVEGLKAEDWTQSGTPKVAAVAKATGLEDIAAAELESFKKAE